MTDSDNIRELLSRPTVNLCPGCKSILGSRQCHFTYSTWNCFGGCGAVLDSRAVSPILAFKCMNDFPDYQSRLGEPVHPLACSCTGRGWYPIGGREQRDHPKGSLMDSAAECGQAWLQGACQYSCGLPQGHHGPCSEDYIFNYDTCKWEAIGE